ncbi:MAG: hypothetical protein SGJ19_02730 [Planctomycetia bacterium]|nr:hypothetical protein [Planctomycetia bacterium]
MSQTEATVAADTPVKKKGGLGNALFGHVLGLLFCVGLPGFVTAIAPVSWIRFERTEDHVTATAQTCLFFFIPYRTQTVDPVIGIDDRFVQGKFERRRPSEPKHRTEDEAFLVINGEDGFAEVPVTPLNIKSVSERSQAFLDDPQAPQLKLFVVANWKFSILVGGALSLLTVLYVVGIVLSFVRMLKRIASPAVE